MLEDVLERQLGMVTRAQALAGGLTDDQIRANVAAKRWRRVFHGVYATFSGPLPQRARIWAALLRAGDEAVASHETAAELSGLLDRASDLIHVSVPHHRTPHRIPGALVHRSRRLPGARHPTRMPPQTRPEETVVDLTQSAGRLNDAIAWLARAVGSRVTTAERLRRVMSGRSRLRWRSALDAALSDVADGCHSVLERAYLRDVERAHGLPRGERQSVRSRAGGRWYEDVRYRAYRTRVELDGRMAHRWDADARDRRADNAAALSGDLPLRYGYGEVIETPCAVAADVVRSLRMGGWLGIPRRCRRPGCGVA